MLIGVMIWNTIHIPPVVLDSIIAMITLQTMLEDRAKLYTRTCTNTTYFLGKFASLIRFFNYLIAFIARYDNRGERMLVLKKKKK